MISWKKNIELLLRVFILLDCLLMLLIFINTQFEFEFPFPLPGRKLNNPLAALLVAIFFVGYLNPDFRENWLGQFKDILINNSSRYYVFGGLILIEIFLQVMWHLYPYEFLWNLNAEQGYGTHFSTIQLYMLGMFVLMIGMEKRANEGSLKKVWPWYLVACMYFFIGLDDCIAIHENFIKWSQQVAPGADTFHFIHEWLWFYGPFMLAAAAFLMRFFWIEFRQNKAVMIIMFVALVMWLGVLVMEGVAKKFIDPYSLEGSRLGIAVEEGLEMFGATLFLIGFSTFYRATKKLSARK